MLINLAIQRNGNFISFLTGYLQTVKLRLALDFFCKNSCETTPRELGVKKKVRIELHIQRTKYSPMNVNKYIFGVIKKTAQGISFSK